jgi:DNA/RNA endonuclease G (NUC1)
MTPGANWVNLIEPIVKISDNNDKFNPTFKWSFQQNGTQVDVDEMSLFISTANAGDGLYPWDLVDSLNSTPWSISSYRPTVDDTHPNRILTLTWKRAANSDYGSWYRGDGTQIGTPERTPTRFTLPDELALTANQGQVYHWAIEAHSSDGKVRSADGTFETPPAPVAPIITNPFVSPSATGTTADSFNGFSGVTIITPNVDPGDSTAVPKSVFDMANGIIKYDGAVLIYDADSERWVPLAANANNLNGTIDSYKTEPIADYQSHLKDFLQNKTSYNYTLTPNASVRKSLVLINDWRDVGTLNNAGWAESAADRTFASLVQLDQILGGSVGERTNPTQIYDNRGNLIRTQGAIFNSRLHLIGEGRGTVVDTEIVQRLGTYFPAAGGQVLYSNGVRVDNENRDLQVTTLDRDNGGIADPRVTTWENVTYADNYYQDSGALTDADWNQKLPSLGNKTAFDWYLGTVNLNAVPGVDLEQWYQGDPIKQGWAAAVLGGEENTNSRKYGNVSAFSTTPPVGYLGNREDLKKDNTATPRQRGDFAVPTLFDGNFDAISTFGGINQSIPGWTGVDQAHLVDWTNIPGLDRQFAYPNRSPIPNTSYLERMGINSTDPNYISNYALKLDNGESLTHNPFVVTDWGGLRFNLYVPETSAGHGGRLKVTLRDVTSGQSLTEEILLNRVRLIGQRGDVDNFYNFDITRDASRKLGSRRQNSTYPNNEINNETRGFETFNVFDIFYDGATQQKELASFRGKSVTLSFEVQGNSGEVYLDDIFLKSPHLRFGEPTPATTNTNVSSSARYLGNNYDTNAYRDNLLLEKPQYAMSYNGTANIPNWVAFKVNQSSISLKISPTQGEGTNGERNFVEDKSLPLGFNRVQETDYNFSINNPYVQGHQIPVVSRSINNKDNESTNILSNILPQNTKNNFPFWEKIENYTQDFVKKGKEVYVINGVDGFKGTLPNSQIQIPENLWKVILVIDRPGADVETSPAYAVGFYTKNEDPGNTRDWRKRDWSSIPDKNDRFVWSLKEVEEKIGYNLFPNLPTEVRNNVQDIKYIFSTLRSIDNWNTRPAPWENTTFTEDNTVDPGDEAIDNAPSAPLMTVESLNSLTNAYSSFTGATVIPNSSIWHDSIAQDSTIDYESLLARSIQHIDIGQVSIFKGNFTHDSSAKIGSSEIGSFKTNPTEFSIRQISTNQDSIIQGDSIQNSPSEIGSSEVGSFHSRWEKSISQVSTTEVSSLLHFRPFKVSSFEVGSTQVDISKEGTVPINSTQISPTQVKSNKFVSPQAQSFAQIDSTKISLPSSITSTELFSSHLLTHNLTPELTNVESTAINIWNTFLQSTTPINLTFDITNLLTGQLAEATITGYDQLGRPNKATISIDDDANGVGWFLDTTPQDNSEFTGVDNYFQAKPNSAAAGKYDILTAILHEMGHTFGIINGYSEFDKHIKNGKFIPTDSPNGAKITLTPDGSHLDSTLYPYDLMNTSLKPGIRKLPSALDFSILNALWSNE